MTSLLSHPLNDHKNATAGEQRCRRCNPSGLLTFPSGHACRDCGGSGWTNSACWADEPHNEIIPGLWQGGAQFHCGEYEHSMIYHLSGNDPFTHVFDCWGRYPDVPWEVYYQHIDLIDGPLTDRAEMLFVHASEFVARAVSRGGTVLVRCQAGLNRSGLLTGLAMVRLGYPAETALAMIRSKRSPWALCNAEFERFLLGFEV